MGGTTPKATLGGPPQPKEVRPLPGSKHSSPAMPRHLAEILTWQKRSEGNSSRNIPMISPQIAPAISPKHLASWQQVPTY